MRKSSKSEINTDYSLYRLSPLQRFLYTAEGLGTGAFVCWLCYHSIYTLPLAIVIAVIFLKEKKKELAEKTRQTLLYHFKDLVSSLHAALRAGYSVENGIISAAKDLEMLYGEKDVLVKEMKNIIPQMKVRIRVEELFESLGERSDLDDIKMFSRLLAIGKRTGGDMSRLLQDTSHILCEKIDTKQEIDAQISSKAFEQKIMSVMPVCIILYLRVSFTGFIEMLYGNAPGIFVMTACLILYAIAFFWGKKIVKIEV